ncbi:hypothetical protein Tco_0513876, partial [Tanacetum coccineum]
ALEMKALVDAMDVDNG